MNVHAGELPDVLILLTAAVVVVAVFRLLRLSPVLGFLVAGAAIGPFGFKLIEKSESTEYLAEFGIVFLLFIIGIELSFKRLREMRLYVIGFGGIQIILTGLSISLIMLLITGDLKSAMLIGAVMALSSTAIVLQVLDERGERMSQAGRISFAVLLMQDLAVIPLLVLLPIYAGEGGDLTVELGRAFAKAMIAIILLVIIGKIILRPFLALIANTKNEDLFVATALLLALGASFATEHFGLSLALGAFLAGLMLSETEFRKQIEADIMPFKGLLLGLFFMTVGMGFNIHELIAKFPEVIFYSVLLIACKALIIIFIGKLFRLSWETSIKSGLLLAQGGEFAFILFNLAIGKGLLPHDAGQMLLLVVTTTMALTPLVYALTNIIAGKYATFSKDDPITETEDLEGHFIIIGFGWVGENLSKLFTMDNYSFVAVDNELPRVKVGRGLGMPVYYGDATRHEILESLQIKKARAVVVSMHDSRPVHRIVQMIHHLYPQVPIVARAKHIENVEAMKKDGATVVVPEAYESAMSIAKASLQIIGTHELEIERSLKKFRAKEIDSAIQDAPE